LPEISAGVKSDRDMLMLKQDNTLPGPIMH